MNVVLVEPNEVDAAGRVRLSGVRARHLARVLRVEPGREVRMGIIDGPMGVGVVEDAGTAAVTLVCRFEPERPPVAKVDVLLALPRPKVMQRLWAQLAALGVGRIILTNAERVERDYFDTHVLAPEVVRGLLIEGLQQARDTRVPQVSIHKRFRVLVEDELDALVGGAARLVAHPGDAMTIAQAVEEARVERVVVAIGPEGGWNAFELGLLESRGFIRVAMGERTLRTDTAVVSLVALVHAALGARRDTDV